MTLDGDFGQWYLTLFRWILGLDKLQMGNPRAFERYTFLLVWLLGSYYITVGPFTRGDSTA